MQTCSIDGCENGGPLTRGWCSTHYSRWHRTGTPTRSPVKRREACEVDDCDRHRTARGWCIMHYTRWQRTGDPLNPGRAAKFQTPAESFAARTERQGDCLIWTGSLASSGYGQITVDGQREMAHRFAWEREHGPIPDGMVVDHICHNRACCAVSHLRLATSAQNAQNRSGAIRNRKHDLPRGVHLAASGRYVATVYIDGKNRNFGTHYTPEAASVAAHNARTIHYGEFVGNN